MPNHISTKHRMMSKFIFVIYLVFFVLVANLDAQNVEYKQEKVKFKNGDVTLAGDLFTPLTDAKCPAVVILHGSGPDEGLGYRIYAEEFAKAGIATLVYDKRGANESGGDWRKRSFELMAGDALAAVGFLQNRAEIDPQKVGLWGISQGGWTVAHAAARSRDVAFVVSVSGNGVSPTQQEMYHKDEMFKALGYSEKARETALKFWKLVFDWLVLLDGGKFPMPENAMQSERSAASIGLNYNPLLDWENVTQPVLLIHGEKDKLSPHVQAISTITYALQKGGNNNFTFRVFPNASHTITTNKTGLEFDWEDNFAPDYFQFATDWIKAKTSGEKFDCTNLPLANYTSSPDFEDAGRYGKLPFYGRTYPQVFLMIFFPIVFLGGTILWIIQLFRVENRQRFDVNLNGILSLVNLLLVFGFFIFIATSVFSQGMSLDSYSMPTWQRFLPLAGNLNLVLTLILSAQIVINRKYISKWRVIFTIISIVFVFWLFYWNFVGLQF
jgi:pimeloyl-ACP methyl ester carboxylesterase